MARILVVDDEASVRETVRWMLEARKHQVAEAEGGAAAMQVLGGTPIDLVMLDMQMPGLSGPEVAALIRAAHPALPVLFLGGDIDANDPSLAGLSAAIVQKPFRLLDLEAAIARALAGPAGEPSGAGR